MIFISEILIAFNTCGYSVEETKYIYDRKTIASKYIKGWFLIDVVAVIPRLARLLESTGEATSLLGILKFARISRIIKLLRLMKYLKVDKAKN